MSTMKVDSIVSSGGTNTAQINGITPALASQAEAEAGTDNTKLMTPLRVAQAVGPATAALAYGAVGTLAYGYLSTLGAVTPGSTYAGSNIFPAAEFCSSAIPADSFNSSNTYYGSRGATALSGTWRALGGTAYASGYITTMFLRVS